MAQLLVDVSTFDGIRQGIALLQILAGAAEQAAQDAQQAQQQPAAQQAPQTAQQPAPGSNGAQAPQSIEQVGKAIREASKALGGNRAAEVGQHMKATFGVSKVSELTLEQAQQLLAFAQNLGAQQ